MVVDTIPMEHAHQTHELMRSLPVRRAVYLAGKVLGIWLAALSSLTIAVLLSLLAWWLRAGAFHPGPYLDVILVGAIPILLINGAIAVLIGATQSSQRRAVMLLVLAFLIPSVLPPALFGSGIFSLLYPGRMAVLEHYIGQAMEAAMFMPPVIPPGGLNFPHVTRTLLVGLAQVGLLWAVVWLWMRSRETQ